PHHLRKADLLTAAPRSPRGAVRGADTYYRPPARRQAGVSQWRRRDRNFEPKRIPRSARCAPTAARAFRPKWDIPIRSTRKIAASGGKRGASSVWRTGVRGCSRPVPSVIKRAGDRRALSTEPPCARSSATIVVRRTWAENQSTTYSAPRWSSVCPFLAAEAPSLPVTVRPLTPKAPRRSFTSSSLKGLITASMRFVTSPPHCKGRPLTTSRGTECDPTPAVAFFRGLPGVLESRAALPKA